MICTPSKKAVDSFLAKISDVVTENGRSDKERFDRLKFNLRGWLDYYKTSTPPSLAEIEFEAVSLVFELSRDGRVAELVGKEFSRYIRDY